MGNRLHARCGHQSVAWFPTTDEGHYLTDSSAGTASEIFRNVANSVPPYTDGTQFDSVKNSYAENGIAPVGEETTETDSKEDKGFFEGCQREGIEYGR